MMNFKIRLMPLLISIIVSSVLIFGGWFVYSSMALKNPLSKIVMEVEGVVSADTQLLRDRVVIEFTLLPGASLREIISEIKTEAHSIIDQRVLDIKVMNSSSDELEQWWSIALFDIAQAMETKHYGDIPKALEARLDQLFGLQIHSEMDHSYVYIRLTHGENSKFIMLPRTPVQLGVWSNE